MNVSIIPKIIRSRGLLSFEDRRVTTSVSIIASKSKFDYPPDYYVVHHKMEAMSGVLERIRDMHNMHQDTVILKRPPRR